MARASPERHQGQASVSTSYKGPSDTAFPLDEPKHNKLLSTFLSRIVTASQANGESSPQNPANFELDLPTEDPVGGGPLFGRAAHSDDISLYTRYVSAISVSRNFARKNLALGFCPPAHTQAAIRTHRTSPRNDAACERKTGIKNTRWCEALPPKKAPKTQSAQLSGAESLTTPALFIVHGWPPIFLFFLRTSYGVRQCSQQFKTTGNTTQLSLISRDFNEAFAQHVDATHTLTPEQK
ncbi:hypothetical protein ACJJTC_016313 [Scirpophaga incertulas]